MSAEGLQPIIQSYIANQQNAAEQQRLQLMRDQMEQSHDMAQKQLDQALKIHQDSLKMAHLDASMKVTDMWNKMAGTPEAAGALGTQEAQQNPQSDIWQRLQPQQAGGLAPNAALNVPTPQAPQQIQSPQLSSPVIGPGSGIAGPPSPQQMRINQLRQAGITPPDIGPQAQAGISGAGTGGGVNLTGNAPITIHPPGTQDVLPEGIQLDPQYRARQLAQMQEEEHVKAVGKGEEYKLKEEAELPAKLAELHEAAQGRLLQARVQGDQRAAMEANRDLLLYESRIQAAQIMGAFKEQNQYDKMYGNYTPDNIRGMKEGTEPIPTGAEYNKAANLARHVGIEIPTQKAALEIGDAGDIEGMFKDSQDFAKKFSIDTYGGSPGDRLKHGADALAAQNSLTGRAGGLSNQMNDSKRFNMAEIVKGVQGVGGSMRQTREENLNNYESYRNAFARKVQALLPNLTPEERVRYMLNHGYKYANGMTIRYLDGPNKGRTADIDGNQYLDYKNRGTRFEVIQ